MRLLGVLLAVGLVFGLSVYAVTRVDDGGPTGGVPSVLTSGTGSAASTPVQRADLAACAAESAVLGTAEEAYFAVNGRYGAGPALVAARSLRSLPTLHRIDVPADAGAFTIVGLGGCP